MLRQVRRMFTQRLAGFDKPTVWHEFTGLANEYKAVNLGQGFPDWDSPEFAKKALCTAVNENYNQYTRSGGEVSLVNALSGLYSPLLNIGRPIDAMTEITISVGATEALFAIMQAFISEGEEVVMLEPAFDIYPAQVQMAGCTAVYVPLRPPASATEQWQLNMSELEAAITPRTKLLLLNTPHNPTGKVLTESELTTIADIMSRHPHVTIITDEVYEHLVYYGRKHTRFASLPGMFDRTITVSSAGKTFSVTGWKIGWTIGPKHLINPIMLANQWVQFSVSTPCQRAITHMIEFAAQPYLEYDSYYAYLQDTYQKKFDFLINMVKEAGLKPLVTEGGFFLLCDIRDIEVPASYLTEEVLQADGTTSTQDVSRDYAFCRWLTKDIGVAAIPATVFFPPERKHLVAHLVRFCACKKDETLQEAAKRLQKLLQHRVKKSDN